MKALAQLREHGYEITRQNEDIRLVCQRAGDPEDPEEVERLMDEIRKNKVEALRCLKEEESNLLGGDIPDRQAIGWDAEAPALIAWFKAGLDYYGEKPRARPESVFLDLPASWRELWEERAAIMEYDGGLPREEAEREALEDIKRQMSRVEIEERLTLGTGA